MKLDYDTTVAFTGHRTYRDEAAEDLALAIRTLYGRGFRTFLSGMALGFDMAAAEAVVALRGELCDIRLVAVIPFEGHDRSFSESRRERYNAILAAADGSIVISPKAHRGCYLRRDDFLVAHAAVLVGWYSGSGSGGTCYTMRRALDRGREVWNLHPNAEVRIQQAERGLFLNHSEQGM